MNSKTNVPKHVLYLCDMGVVFFSCALCNQMIHISSDFFKICVNRDTIQMHLLKIRLV